nr:hypothetical protein SrhCFBP13529_20060 [Stenotrophomonas rhizophila]
MLLRERAGLFLRLPEKKREFVGVIAAPTMARMVAINAWIGRDVIRIRPCIRSGTRCQTALYARFPYLTGDTCRAIA